MAAGAPKKAREVGYIWDHPVVRLIWIGVVAFTVAQAVTDFSVGVYQGVVSQMPTETTLLS